MIDILENAKRHEQNQEENWFEKFYWELGKQKFYVCSLTFEINKAGIPEITRNVPPEYVQVSMSYEDRKNILVDGKLYPSYGKFYRHSKNTGKVTYSKTLSVYYRNIVDSRLFLFKTEKECKEFYFKKFDEYYEALKNKVNPIKEVSRRNDCLLNMKRYINYFVKPEKWKNLSKKEFIYLSGYGFNYNQRPTKVFIKDIEIEAVKEDDDEYVLIRKIVSEDAKEVRFHNIISMGSSNNYFAGFFTDEIDAQLFYNNEIDEFSKTLKEEISQIDIYPFN